MLESQWSGYIGSLLHRGREVKESYFQVHRKLNVGVNVQMQVGMYM